MAELIKKGEWLTVRTVAIVRALEDEQVGSQTLKVERTIIRNPEVCSYSLDVDISEICRKGGS